MSARCRIGIKLNDGKVVSIYNHSDGYPTGVGRILDEYYNTRESIMMLINLGDISMLGTEPVDCPELWDFESGMSALARDAHYTNIPFCRTYKGRGEKGVGAKVSASVEEYVDNLCEEYNYLYDGGKWFVVKDGKTVERQTIYEAIKAEEENGY